MNALRTVGQAARDGARIGLRRGVLLASGGALVALALSMCILPFFVGLGLLGAAVGDASRAPERSLGTIQLAGFSMLAVLASPGAGVFAAAAVVPIPNSISWTVLTLWAIVPAFAMVSGPFLTVAHQLYRRDAGLGDAIGRALSAAALHGVTVTLLRGGVLGSIVALPPVLFVLGAMPSSPPIWMVLQFIALLVLPGLGTAWVVGFSAACADQDDALLAQAAPPLPKSSFLFAPMVALLALSGAFAAVLMTPSPPWMSTPAGVDAWECTPELSNFGPQGLSIRHVPPTGSETFHGFEVSVADGGGAGALGGGAALGASRVCIEDEHSVWVRFSSFGPDVYVHLDERGVRLDDGLGDRLRVRLTATLLWGIVLGFAFFAVALVILARRLALLDAISRAGDALRSVRGHLTFDPDASVSATGAVTGVVRFTSSDGAYSFVLPQKIHVAGRSPKAEQDALLVSSEPLTSLNLRSGSEHWPRSAILVSGPADDARTVIASSLGRAAGPWAAAACICFGLATLGLLFQL